MARKNYIALSLFIVLFGCGQKGDLVLYQAAIVCNSLSGFKWMTGP